MSATGLVLSGAAWSRVGTGSRGIAAADRDALGTTARLVVWPAENLAGMLAIVDGELAALDAQASRFREDSEISALHGAPGARHRVSDGLAEVVAAALAAAAWTGGRCDPTVGSALVRIGYDRDFVAIGADESPLPPEPAGPAGHAGWRSVRLRGNELSWPAGVLLDFGATAKGLGADRAAKAAYASAADGGVLVSIGGDIAVAGRPPAGGWPVLVADEHRQVRAVRNLAPCSGGRRPRPGPAATADPAIAQQVRLARGGLATSSSTCRRWQRAGSQMHHIIDPATGMPSAGPWRTVTVAAATCAEANGAATAAVVAGDDAPAWLAEQGLPAKLIGHNGLVRTISGWPEGEDGLINPPAFSWLAAYTAGAGR